MGVNGPRHPSGSVGAGSDPDKNLTKRAGLEVAKAPGNGPVLLPLVEGAA